MTGRRHEIDVVEALAAAARECGCERVASLLADDVRAELVRVRDGDGVGWVASVGVAGTGSATCADAADRDDAAEALVRRLRRPA